MGEPHSWVNYGCGLFSSGCSICVWIVDPLVAGGISVYSLQYGSLLTRRIRGCGLSLTRQGWVNV